MRDFEKFAAQLELREKEAGKLVKRLKTALEHLQEKVSSYNGKAKFTDRLISIQGELKLLDFNLRLEK